LYPSGRNALGIYGLVEIKRPSTLVVVQQRKEVLTLSRDVATAVEQLKTYGRTSTRPPILTEGRCVLLGNREHLFIIAGLTDDLAHCNGSELSTDGLIPSNCELVPYDVLATRLEMSIPRIHLLTLDPVAWFYSKWNPSEWPSGSMEEHNNRRYAAAQVDDLSERDQERLYALEPWLRWAVDDLYAL
jgi:hypothetical protein